MVGPGRAARWPVSTAMNIEGPAAPPAPPRKADSQQRRRVIGQSSEEGTPQHPDTMFRVSVNNSRKGDGGSGPALLRRRCRLPPASVVAPCFGAAIAVVPSPTLPLPAPFCPQPSKATGPLSARSAGRLEPRHTDPLESTESGGATEWEKEPILNLVTAVLGNCVLGGCWDHEGQGREGGSGPHAITAARAPADGSRQHPPQNCLSPLLPAPGFPFCFKTCGLGLAVLLVLVTLAAAELSMRLLLMAAQLTGKRSYDELARHAFGRSGAGHLLLTRAEQGGTSTASQTDRILQLLHPGRCRTAAPPPGLGAAQSRHPAAVCPPPCRQRGGARLHCGHERWLGGVIPADPH